jgi:hypothetical protein
MNTATYTPDRDIIEPYSDSSGFKVIFSAGQPIAWATALELGLVSGDPPVDAPKRRPIKIDADND